MPVQRRQQMCCFFSPKYRSSELAARAADSSSDHSRLPPEVPGLVSKGIEGRGDGTLQRHAWRGRGQSLQ